MAFENIVATLIFPNFPTKSQSLIPSSHQYKNQFFKESKLSVQVNLKKKNWKKQIEKFFEVMGF
jgi:hypothetical protein